MRIVYASHGNDGMQVGGSIDIEREYDAAKVERHSFRGELRGATLTVRFTGGRAPDFLPAKRDPHVWRLATERGETTLNVVQYGRNHETNAYTNYTAVYAACAQDAAALASSARRVAFARGASSAPLITRFTTNTDKTAYLLTLGKGQAFTVNARGCGIGLYYPDRKRHDDTPVDRLFIPVLPANGDYLVVLSPTGAARQCEATLTAK